MLSKVYVLVLCFWGLSSVLATSELVPAAGPVAYNLKNLNEHGHTSVITKRSKVKHTVFTPGESKTVNSVVYDTHTLWPNDEHPANTTTFKSAEVYEKLNLPQLVHLTLVKDTQNVEVYYKKTKTDFQKLNDKNEFDAGVTFLTQKSSNHYNRWFPLDLESTLFDRRFVTDQLEMKDGVKLRTLKFSSARPSFARFANNKFWDCTDDNKYLTQVYEHEFGDDNWLLDLSLYGGDHKYFVKTREAPAWAPLESGTAFDSKTKDFKSKYFKTRLEYDVAQKPDLQKYHVQRSSGPGNKNVLSVSPTRDHYVGKVMFGITDLWSSTDSNERVVKLKVTLLDYEVMQVSLQVHSGTKATPTFLYFSKENGALKQNPDKQVFQSFENKLDKLVKPGPFHYNSDWVLTASSLDLSNFSETQVSVRDSPVANGVLTRTLTSKTTVIFVRLVFGNVTLWPSTQHTATNPVVKTVELVYKYGLLQLVHLNATKSDGATEGAQNVVVDLFFKKARDSFLTFSNMEHSNLKSELRRDTVYVDKYVHLDVNDLSLDPNLYTVNTDFVDGVEKKVVTVKVPKVVKVTNRNHALWSDSLNPTYYLEKLELHTTTENARVLSLLVKHDSSSKKFNHFFEKVDGYAEWKPLGQLNEEGLHEKLVEHKAKHEAKSVELDVSVKPNKDLFDVKVTPLTGARTELVLTPLRGKHLKKVVNGNGDSNVLWTPGTETETTNRRVVRAHLYLENYSVKHLKLEVWENPTNKTTTKTTVTKTKNTDNNTFGEGGGTFEQDVNSFKSGGGNTKFQYDEEWVLPPTKFDPVKFKEFNFEVTKGEVAGSPVKTTKYAPKAWNLVNEVVYDEDKVWPQDGLTNADKKLVFLEVFTKDNLVQLLHVQVVPTAGDSPAAEDLYFMKQKGAFTKLQDVNEFTTKKDSLKSSDTFVDDNVKLDLSTQAPEALFTTTSVLEDGLEKTVLDLKHGKLYEVKGSPAFWTSKDGSFVRKLEKYVTEASHLVVLYVTKGDVVTKEFFEKSLTPSPQVAEQTLQESPQQAPAFATKPKEEFFAKMAQVKDTLQTNTVTFNPHNYADSHFKSVEGTDENTKLYKLFPLSEYRVNKLVQDDEDLWPGEDGKKVVELHVHVHESKPKFVKAVVWKNNRTDETPDEFLFYKLDLETNKFVKVAQENQYNEELAALKKVVQTPLEPSSGGELPTKGKEFFKFSLSDNVDSQLFVVNKETRGDYTLNTFTPRNDTFVNVVEVPHALLWKAEAKNHLWKSATFALTANGGHADLTVTKNKVDSHLYFKLEDDEWTPVTNEVYLELHGKVPAPTPVPGQA